jgi:hypothetical protein
MLLIIVLTATESSRRLSRCKMFEQLPEMMIMAMG